MVACMVCAKVGDWVIGPFMVTEAGLFDPVYEPDPDPVQLVKAYPLLAVAVMGTNCPLSNQLLTGVAVPPVVVFVVRKYCAVKFAV